MASSTILLTTSLVADSDPTYTADKSPLMDDGPRGLTYWPLSLLQKDKQLALCLAVVGLHLIELTE